MQSRRTDSMRQPPWRRRWQRTSVPIAVVLLSPLVIFIGFRLRQEAGVEQQLDCIRASGVPVTVQELNEVYHAPREPARRIAGAATPAVNAQQDAAALYEEAFTHIGPEPEGYSYKDISKEEKEVDKGEPYPASLLEGMHAYLAFHAERLCRLQRVAQHAGRRRHALGYRRAASGRGRYHLPRAVVGSLGITYEVHVGMRLWNTKTQSHQDTKKRGRRKPDSAT